MPIVAKHNEHHFYCPACLGPAPLGPTTLFDKSFLQALNRDEAAVFDVLFRANLTPLFFAETLADLEGGLRGGQTPEAIVGNLASKTPVWGSAPVASHIDLALGDLMGHRVAMNRVPVLGGGRCIETGGKKGIVFDHAPEMEAYNRWQRGDFAGVERNFAKAWREALRLAPKNVDAIIGIDGQKLRLRDLSAVKAFVDEVIAGEGKTWAVLKAAMRTLQVPDWAQRHIAQRWKQNGRPKLRAFAPYAAHVFGVELFFHVAAATGKIAAERPSNRIDIAYLHYLPFAEVFVSGDGLHERTAVHFLGEGQLFVRSAELKKGLAELDAHYSAHPDIATSGLMKVASWPPTVGKFFVANLFDQLRPNWRKRAVTPMPEINPEMQAKVLADLKAYRDPQAAKPARQAFGVDAADSVILERRVPLRRGKWQFMPPGLKGDAD